MHNNIFDSTALGRGGRSTHRPLASTREEADLSRGTASSSAGAAVKRVLLVDDNRDALDVLCLILEEVGHVVVTADDGLSALEALTTFSADVAVIDIGLPVMDGYELAREMRKGRSDGVPGLIALTGYAEDSDRSRTMEAGFAVHLTKPVDRNHLLAAIQHTRRLTAAPAGDSAIDPETDAEP